MNGAGITPVKVIDKNNNTIPLEQAAEFGMKMPEGLHVADQALFLGLRMLYGSIRLKIIDDDRFMRERRKLIQECEHFRFRDDLAFRYADIIRRTELAKAAYRKERSLENADQLMVAVEGRKL